MTPDRWQEVQALFATAVELAPAAQAAYLAEACAGDPTLRDEVLALLAADRRADASPFISNAVGVAAEALAGAPAPSRLGERVGPYRLIRELGRGGMGTVYLAERVDGQYQASVAIKFVRGTLAAPELARRLVAERQILAGLTHPNIAWLLDGGTAADGTPYLVMEHVAGEAIDRWCERRGLGLPARLALFRRVAAAVQYAHQALVVHRDLKPSNILVTADGTPKLVDFGIAKLLAGEAAEATATVRALTPAYAAPEQVIGGRITVATDVYGLGGVLYRLLTGRAPLEVAGLSPGEIEHRICEQLPAAPSVAAQAAARAWRRSLKGDLDTIVLTALRKEPERRYATADALADDVRRFELGHPVRARPASWRYRAGKFVVRHRAAVGTGALLCVALTGGLGATLWQARRARQAQRATVAALAQSNATKDFLLDLFRASDPTENRGAQITARALLARGAARVDSLTGQPALQADLLETLARVEMSLGEYRLAERMAGREAALRRLLPGEPDSLLAGALETRGQALDHLAVPDSAAAVFEHVVALEDARGAGDGPLALTALDYLASEYGRLGRDSASNATLERVVAIQRRTLPADAPARVEPLSDLGLQLAIEGRFTEAVPLLREALRVAADGDTAMTSPATLDVIDNLGMALRGAGDYDEAEPLVRRELATRVRVLGPRHRFTADAYFSLGLLLALRGRPGDFVESDSLLHACLDVFRATLGPRHRAVAYGLYALGVLDLRRGDPAAAERDLRQALAIRRATAEDSPRETVRTLIWLSQAQLARSEAEAGATMREADSLARATLAPGDPVRSRAAVGYAVVLARAGRMVAAEPAYRDAMDSLVARLGDTHPLVRAACEAGSASGLAAGRVCGAG
jgi:eukaryotic-like serine/threonine-protein kinase